MSIINIIMAIFAALPSAFIAYLFKRFEKKQESREKARRKKDVLVIKSVGASMALGEAVALALKNGKSNGETEAALIFAKEIKREQNDFLMEQGINNLN